MQIKRRTNGALTQGRDAALSVLNPANGSDIPVHAQSAHTALRHQMVAH